MTAVLYSRAPRRIHQEFTGAQTAERAGTEGDGIYRSSDQGDTWAKTDINNSLLAQQLVFAFCAKDDALYAGADNGIYKSTDGGTTFQRSLNGFPPNIGVFAWSLTVSGGNVVAAVSVSFSPSEGLNGIFYSSDDGSTWHQATLPIEPTAVTAVASDGSSLAYAALFGQSFSVKGLYKSTDAGVTWSQRQATVTATSTPTSTPTPTATVTATVTPRPTPTPRPRPTPPPRP